MHQKILITGANNAMAYQLAWHFKNEEILFCDIANHTNIAPLHTSNSYAHQFLKYCLTHQINRAFILRTQEIMALEKCELLFQEFGVELMFVQATVLQHINSIIKSNAVFEVNNFGAFSAMVLKAGYPKNVVWFGKADFNGQFYQINDGHSAHILWNHACELSFLQASKQLQQTEFIPLHIYSNKPIKVNALCVDGAIYYNGDIDSSTFFLFKNLQSQFDLKGYFELTIFNNQLLFLKMLTV